MSKLIHKLEKITTDNAINRKKQQQHHNCVHNMSLSVMLSASKCFVNILHAMKFDSSQRPSDRCKNR